MNESILWGGILIGVIWIVWTCAAFQIGRALGFDEGRKHSSGRDV